MKKEVTDMLFWIEALVLCAVFTAIVVPSAMKDPLAWVDSYPPAIGERCRELGLVPKEQKHMPFSVVLRKVIFSLFAVVLLALAAVFLNHKTTFLGGFLLSYGLWLVVDWYDALILDCCWVCHSRRVIIPGTEDLTGAYHDYKFHILQSCLGMAIGLPVALLAGLATRIIAGMV